MKRIVASFVLIAGLSTVSEVFAERDLETGVFLSRDPAGFVDGPNVYSYVKQNPWTCFDPEGLWLLPMDKTTQQIVSNVENADPKLGQIVMELRESPYPFQISASITASARKNGVEERGSTSPGILNEFGSQVAAARTWRENDRYNGKGMGASIVTASETIDGKTPEQTMAHELGHAFDINRGITPVVTQAQKGLIGKVPYLARLIDTDENENRAVRTENIYNEKKGLDIRKTYPVTGVNGRSKEQVPNPEGKNAPVNTEPKEAAPHLRKADNKTEGR